MNVDRIIQKLEVNESVISTFFGGVVLVVVAVLMLNYFLPGQKESEEKVADLDVERYGYSDTVPIEDAGQISATSVGTYKVKAGDSLWKIADELYGDGFAWKEIAQANTMASPDLIEVGQVLNVPSKVDFEPPAQMGLEKPDNYIVKRGDYLWDIAARYYGDGFKWVEIWRANSGEVSDPDLLKVGQLLELP